MPSPFDIAWTLLKNVDFEDVGPMPTRYLHHPASPGYRPPPDLGHPSASGQTEEQYHQMQMEGTYTPDMQRMLELEALRQASGGQQVPRSLLQPRNEYGYEEDPHERNWGATTSDEMLNLPTGRSQQYPLPLTTYDKRAPDPEFTGE
jgi:hypothetical protein